MSDGPTGRGAGLVTRVASRDGTKIGYWTSGEGPPLLLIHGNPADHTRWRPLLPYIEPHATVHAIDRRGRGASDDGPTYEVEREYEDVAAVVDAIADASGSPVDVYGHSMGGFIAFGAARLTSRIGRLALYEGWPPTNPEVFAYPPGFGEQLDALLAAGDRDALLQTYLRDLLQMSDDDVQAFRKQPSWQGRIAAAHTITREDRAFFDTPFDPEQAAQIKVPTLLLTGGDSPGSLTGDIETVVAAFPDARIVVIEGQQHVADVLDPETFAGHLLSFLRPQS